jgi:hypothetical protein
MTLDGTWQGHFEPRRELGRTGFKVLMLMIGSNDAVAGMA